VVAIVQVAKVVRQKAHVAIKEQRRINNIN
jgi:hypothetical protein